MLTPFAEEGWLDDPAGIINFDESAFQLDEEYDKVFAARGAPEVVSFLGGDPKERITVLVAGSAQGKIFRPLALYDGKVNLLSRLEGTDDNCCVSTDPSGWMDPDVLTEYFRLEIIPKLTADKVSQFI